MTILNKLFDICGRGGGPSTQNKILFYYTFIFDGCEVVMLLDTFLSVTEEVRVTYSFAAHCKDPSQFF
jgi:hypothetical protein